MKKNAAVKTWLPLLLAAVLIAAVFATGALRKQKTWIEMLFFQDIQFSDGQARSLENGGEYGVMNSGPHFILPVGTYRLKYIVDTDGENHIRLTTSNNARISPDRLPVKAGGWTNEATFTVLDPANGFEIQAVFEDGTYMQVHDFRLYSPWYTDNAFTFALIAAALCALWVAHRRGWLTPERCGRLLIIGFAVLLSSTPALKDNLSHGDDVTFHMARFMNLVDALKSGQFPARVGAFSYNGYGAVTSVFYPDLFLVPFALMSIAGASIQYALHLYTIVVNIVASWAMYVCAKRIFGDRDTATCASVLYTLAVYRVTDVYVRFAMGEATAMGVLPLFLLGLWEVVFGDKSRWRILAVSAAAICMSHMLSTLMCALMALGLCVLFIVRIVREKRLLSLIKAAAVAAGLCVFWLAPLMMYSADGISADAIRYPTELMQMMALSPAQLLLWGEGDLTTTPLDTSLPQLPAEISLPLLLGALILLHLYITSSEERDRSGGFAVLFTLAGLATALMSTTLFPWGYISVLTKSMADYIQFPWRLLMFTSALLALAAGYGYVRLAGGHARKMIFGVLALAAVMVLPTLSAQTRNNIFYEFGQGASPYILYYEYQLPGANIRKLYDRDWHAEGEVAVTDYEKDGTNVTAHVDADTDARLSLPLFGFRGYAAEVDGQKLDWTLGDNDRLTVLLPAGTSGMLHVWFEGEGIWRVFDAISLVTLLALTGDALLRRRRVNQAQGRMTNA